ncbi:MAG: ATP-binding protein [Pseudomonadota bacterium]
MSGGSRRADRGGIREPALGLAVLAATAGPAQAAGFDFAGLRDLPLGTLTLVVSGLALLVFISALYTSHSSRRQVQEAADKIADLESRLNDAELLLTAEPHLLFIWSGRSDLPDKISGDMRGTCVVPKEHNRLSDFAFWLEPQSASELQENLRRMRETGEPFNFGVDTRGGELIEADGRTAGGMATLRLRPLTGEREDNTKLSGEVTRLKRQVSQLSTILDNAPLPIWLRNNQRRIVWSNQAYMKAVEAESITQIVQEGREIAPPQDPQTERQGGEGALRANTVINGEKRTLDLVEVDVEHGFAGFAIDVSEQEKTEKELKRHIEAHSRTLDNLKTAVAIFGPDQRLRFFNVAYAELWQLEPAWLQGQPAQGEILDKLREARRLPEQASYRDWKAKQLSVYVQMETEEDWWYLPDGQTIRVITEQHPFGGVTFLFENVTERLELESRYNELTSVQGETLDNLDEGLALFGSDGRLKLFNPPFARFWNINASALDEEPHVDQVINWCRKLLPMDPVWDKLKFAITSLESERTPSKDQIVLADSRVFNSAIVPLPDGNTLITYVDVTASSRMERALRERAEALEAADKLKTDFLSNVSYELRTPLTSINGFAEALDMGIAGELTDRQSEYLHDIQNSSSQLLSIIDSILDLASIDAGAMELALGKIDVTKLLTDAAGLVRDRVKKQGVTLEVVIPDAAEMMIGDEQRLKQVLFNLLSNAIGFSYEGDTVRLGCRRDGEHIRIWVSDTGRGMDPETQQSAFDRFSAKPARSGHRGAGLGLSIVKSFVELHDGAIELQSEIGEGTTVTMELPRVGPMTKPDGRETDAHFTESARLSAS